MNESLMIYAEECLVIASEGKLTVLHRQSYYKKCVIRVSDKKIKRVRRVNDKGYKGLICIDTFGKVVIVNVDN